MAKTREERNARKRERARELRAERKANHQCVKCGAPLQKFEYNLRCKACLKYQSDKAKEYRKIKREASKSIKACIPESPNPNLSEAQRKFLAEEKARLAKDKKEAVMIAIGHRIDNKRVRHEIEEARQERLARLDKMVASLKR